MQSLTTRLEQLYASAVYDTLRAMGHDNCVLPSGISALIPGQKLVGEVFTIDGQITELRIHTYPSDDERGQCFDLDECTVYRSSPQSMPRFTIFSIHRDHSQLAVLSS